MAFESIDGPLGPRRSDFQAALIAATVANGVTALGGKRGSRRLTDFLFEWDRTAPQSADDMLAKIREIAHATGGKVVKRG